MADTKDGRPHRWVNTNRQGTNAFVTTTCLDFVLAFQRSEMRELACLSILRDIQRYGANLHAFVVMTHHIHLLITCPEDKTISWLIQRLKSNLAKIAIPKLTYEEASAFGAQKGLNNRRFWKPGFRSLDMCTEPAFEQKANYIHQNPVRAGMVESAEEYRWSSQRFWQDGFLLPTGLDLERVLEGFDQSISTEVRGVGR